jgi:hypothetical protein
VSRQTKINPVCHKPRHHSRPATSFGAVLSLSQCRFVFLAAALVKEKTSRHRQKGQTMTFEDIKTKTKDAVDYLAQSLESGQSDVLTQYLAAMARFHTYSFGNVMLIARQRAVTCCYTSLESMNMRSRALLEASDGA